jgi:hypothetical protein
VLKDLRQAGEIGTHSCHADPKTRRAKRASLIAARLPSVPAAPGCVAYGDAMLPTKIAVNSGSSPILTVTFALLRH